MNCETFHCVIVGDSSLHCGVVLWKVSEMNDRLFMNSSCVRYDCSMTGLGGGGLSGLVFGKGAGCCIASKLFFLESQETFLPVAESPNC